MQITAYPPYRRLIGSDTLVADLPAGSTVRELLFWLGQIHPSFAEFANAPSDEFLWGQLIVHVNDEIVGLRAQLQPDDRIDLLPPLAGG